jgi:serine/threonine protein kinase
MKPENVMLDANGHAKVIDFGLSKEGTDFPIPFHNGSFEGFHVFKGTYMYMAPELYHMASEQWRQHARSAAVACSCMETVNGQQADIFACG